MQPVQELTRDARKALQAIGYRDELLATSYQFADFLSDSDPLKSTPVREITLAGFATQPYSYRTACIGFHVLENETLAIHNFGALGSPQILVANVQTAEIQRWGFRSNDSPILIDTYGIGHLNEVIISHEDEWKPETVIRAKSIGYTPATIQLDFFDYGLLPVLEREVHRKLDELFRRTVSEAAGALEERKKAELEATDYQLLFRLIFRLVAAKLLADRQYAGNWLDSDVSTVIQNVNDFYFKTAKPEAITDDPVVQQLAWDSIRNGYRFQNVSLEALAYIYENTFVSREMRQKYSTHATPPEVAEYVLRHLPVEDIEEPLERTIFEPFTGAAPFLIAGLGRLRGLLPPGVDATTRHGYLVKMLSGMELDSFAREVARYSLILADYPNPDGWHIEEADVFASPRFDQHLKQANIVLCNPPFSQFSLAERKTYSGLRSTEKAAETLLKVLESPPSMLGFVLPAIFLDGQSYRGVRTKLVELYESISIVGLPDIAFRYSEMPTVMLLASNKVNVKHRAFSIYNALISKADYHDFWITGQTTWESTRKLESPESGLSLWHSPLADKLRIALSDLRPLKDIAEIHRGIQYNEAVSLHVSEHQKQGYKPGLFNKTSGFMMYVVTEHCYLDTDVKAMRWYAYKLPWHKEKVIVPAYRASRGPWRILAAVDYSGLLCLDNFHGIWSKNDYPLELIASIINGPVANALLSADAGRWNHRLQTLGTIPVPSFTHGQEQHIQSLIREYREIILKEGVKVTHEQTDEIIAQIDTAVLTAYNLPDTLEIELMNFIGEAPRPYGTRNFIEILHYRRNKLVDKKYMDGLNEPETKELQDINRIIDASEASFYDGVLESVSSMLNL